MDKTKISKLTNELSKILGTPISFSESENTEEVTERLAALINAYNEKYDVTTFLSSLISGSIPKEKVPSLAKRFHLAEEGRRVLFYLQVKADIQEDIILILKNLFPSRMKIHYIIMDKNDLAILIPIKDEKEEEVKGYADTIISTLNAEAMVTACIACSETFLSLYDIKEAYREARYTMKVGRMFQYGSYVFHFSELGIGRIIAETPVSVCKRFIEEVFGKGRSFTIDDETLMVVNTFLKNNLNIAESSRALHMHRNTLLYRIEQISKNTNLDIRNFEDAMTLKIATMVLNYIKQEEN